MTRLEDQLNEAALNKCIEQRDKAEKYCEQLKVMLASASDRADEQQHRAEAAESQLTAAVLPVAELVARANEAAQLEAKLHLAHVESQSAWDSEAQWKAAANRLQAEVEARRELRDIRTLIDADDDESTADEVAGKVSKLKQANERIEQLEANRDELAHKIDALYKQIEECKKAVDERDAARRELEQAQEDRDDLREALDDSRRML